MKASSSSLAVFALCAVTYACQEDSSTSSRVTCETEGTCRPLDAGPTPIDGGPAEQAVTLQFQARVGSEPFACNKSFANVGTPPSTVEPLTFAFYIHHVRAVTGAGVEVPLVLTQDAKWQYEDVALLDFEDQSGTCSNGTADTNTVVKGTFAIPVGTALSGIRFKVGIPEVLNHGNVATQPSPLNLSSMFWDWQSGHKFMRIDFRVQATADAGPSGAVLLHLGSTGCSMAGGSAACSNQNRPDISLPGPFDPATNKIVLDYAKLVAGNDLNSNKGGPPGCMADATDPECASIFTSLGLDVATGGPGASVQTAFRIE